MTGRIRLWSKWSVIALVVGTVLIAAAVFLVYQNQQRNENIRYAVFFACLDIYGEDDLEDLMGYCGDTMQTMLSTSADAIGRCYDQLEVKTDTVQFVRCMENNDVRL